MKLQAGKLPAISCKLRELREKKREEKRRMIS